jgi:hypothetical protein
VQRSHSGIEGDGELAGKPVGFALSRAKSLGTASNNGVDVLSQWADRGPRCAIGFSHVFAALPAPSTKDDGNGSRHENALGNDFGRRLDMNLPRNVRVNVVTGIFDARSRFSKFSAG